jgi:hypothetical protein
MEKVNKKNSFVLYHDLINVVEKLTKKDREDNTNNAGELFLLILEYVNGENGTPPNFIVEMAFEPIRQQLNRDFEKWETERQKRIEAGRKGGEKSAEVRRAKANEASASPASNIEANEASASFGTNEADANKADTTRKASTGLSYIDEDDLPF